MSQLYIEKRLPTNLALYLRDLSSLQGADFSPVRFDDEITAYLRKAPNRFHIELKQMLSGKFKILELFLRYNSPYKDTVGRIHTDCITHGISPTHAMIIPVLGSHGTGLFEHPVFGRTYNEGDPTAFNNPSSEWNCYETVSVERGSFCIFDARLWHCRVPFKSKEQRIVVVAFLEALK